MGYEAKVVLHSAGPAQQELLTVQCRFPRIVLAEVVTHRACPDTIGGYEEIRFPDSATTDNLSKNSASSRAIPLARMIKAVWDDPYVPERFSAAGKGMQGDGWLEGADHEYSKRNWLYARNDMIRRACSMLTVGDLVKLEEQFDGELRKFVADSCAPRGLTKSVHKQDVNRLLEPWGWVTQVITADSGAWNNFWALRCDAAAHPAFQKVARMIYLAFRKSAPRRLNYGEWHLPFVGEKLTWSPEIAGTLNTGVTALVLPDLIKHSAARCAWVSYESHDKDASPAAMLSTFDRLMAGNPKHASPVEHQATPMAPVVRASGLWRSNLRGWIQARKLVLGERTEAFAPSDAEVASWGLEGS